jgi:protease-4
LVKAPDVIDYTQRENVAERLVKRFGVAVGEGTVRAVRSSASIR